MPKPFNAKYYRKEKLVPSSDDWYPTVNGLVKLVTNPLNTKPILYRVSVWGGDDCGMEIDFSTKAEANRLFEKLANCTDVTKSLCASHGMQFC